jgi:DNA-binding PadR family transcriptional regulator
VSDHNRQARFYELSRSGRKQLDREVEDWQRLTTAVNQVLRETES